MQIPLPPRGFWAKAEHGHKVRRPGLPDLKPGEAEVIVIHPPLWAINFPPRAERLEGGYAPDFSALP